ncbi:MOSC domain protein [Posidoniimonas polymericola]|uniref:MOSC domain protein n=1 Tax=Posidoniimonas polymericola TaxID=2528002 RepID=A0A5C5YKQ0_9BACT|nr:MOSC N-terminal beta barrel domain-containing protein [Posidoniimonas polymericola]TWT75490.1 MOSC domain protein [Posidoniimonas polymericola]
MITIARLTVYPIKSLDGLDLAEARVLASGALRHDRRYAFRDADDKTVNAKRTAAIQRLRSEFRPDAAAVRLQHQGASSDWLELPDQREEAAAWAGERLGQACTLDENPSRGFPDDTDAPGPTLISTASLAAIAAWFDLPVDEARRRLRANIEIDARSAFWEDRLAGREFMLGTIRFAATGVCQRCAVPVRDSLTGETTAGFQKRFAKQREAELPAESPRTAFDHYYRAAINTRLTGVPATLRVGDAVEIAE